MPGTRAAALAVPSGVIVPCISLWQPWASLVFVADPELRKIHETRGWEPPERYIRCPLAIHASQKVASVAEIGKHAGLHDLCVAAFGWTYRQTLPQGAVLGTVSIFDVAPAWAEFAASPSDLAAGIWAADRFAWRLQDPQPLAEPLPQRGRQGWFSVELPA